MSDDAPDLLYSLDAAGEPIVLIERATTGTQEDVLERFPGLITGEHTTELAKLVNHFARQFQYEVIEDPKAYEDAFLAQLATEDPNATWQQGVNRLRDFGMPVFENITVPTFDGSTLVYYVKSVRHGLPFVARVPINGTEIGEADYDTIEMRAFAD